MRISINGKFVQKIQLNGTEPEFNFGYGVFETIRTCHHIPFALSTHLQRLRRSAKNIGLKIQVTDATLKHWVEKHCQTKNEIRFKIIAVKNRIYILSIPLAIKPNLKKKGVAVNTYPITRFQPVVKGLSWVQEYRANQYALAHGYHDALLINHKKQIPEASCGNVFYIKKGIVYTSDKQILYGITRGVALRLLKNDTRVVFTMPTLNKLITADECFITSTISGIIPVVRIDEKTISTGKPGPITLQLLSKYEEYVETTCK
ncbi:MAG: hypothetical protein ACD_43C00226G0003 [uncultured bacterium]|nr:MAG: hypothetical protein ACD_43C00226G0003 [uncultured bacterium]